MLKLFSRLFQPRQPAPKVVPLAVRGKYDAAQTTVDNRRHWAIADGLSAAAANSRTVRRTLRNRARYEVANNSYAKGIIATLANDVVGRGPILQVAAGAAEANTRIERAFSNWAIEIGLAQKLRTMRQSKAIDGEAFAMLVTNEALRSPIKLDLKLIEAEQVTDPDDSQNHADEFAWTNSKRLYFLIPSFFCRGGLLVKHLPPLALTPHVKRRAIYR